MPNKVGRPTEYSDEILKKAKKYLADCKDKEYKRIKTDGSQSTSYEHRIKVKLPSIEGLARYLGVARSSIYEWAKATNEDENKSLKYPEFSDTLESILAEQAQRLINNGLSGDYNPLIAKLILSANHNMREKSDMTTNDKDLPTPILNGLSTHNRNKEGSEPSEED